MDPQLSKAAEEGRSAFAEAHGAARTGALPSLRSVIDAVLSAVGEAPSGVAAPAAKNYAAGSPAADSLLAGL